MYYIGFAKRKHTMVIEARRNKDYLSCELYDYLGQFDVTKQFLHKHHNLILDKAKEWRPEVYGDCKFAVVG